MKRIAFRLGHLLLSFLLLAGLAPGLWAQEIAPDSPRNSPKIVKIFSEALADASESAVRIACDGRDAALGAIVDADGLVITKASLLHGNIVCKLKDGRELAAEILGENEPYDLALLKIPAKGLSPVQWRKSKELAQGKWVCCLAPAEDPVAIGVVGVATRSYKSGDQPPKTANSKSGFLGVSLENADAGAKIMKVSDGGPGAKAGLKVNDIVVKVNEVKILDVESFINTVQAHKVGEQITLKVHRGKETLDLKATLGKAPRGAPGANPQDLMGTTLSARRGGFPSILQTDCVLLPRDCGGPLCDLDGKTVGINIARAGRTETYAVPSEAVLSVLDELKSGKQKNAASVPVPDKRVNEAKPAPAPLPGARPINDLPNETLVLKAAGKLAEGDPLDKLRDKNFHKVHVLKLKAGVEYQIDLISVEFDAFLRLEDAKGKQLAEDDDGGGDLNARIVFRAPADGEYRIIATSFGPDERGDYLLTVRQKGK